MTPRYNLRPLPHRLWLAPIMYGLPQELLYHIALLAAAAPDRPRGRYRLRPRRSAA